jgi:hypothetical protein
MEKAQQDFLMKLIEAEKQKEHSTGPNLPLPGFDGPSITTPQISGPQI